MEGLVLVFFFLPFLFAATAVMPGYMIHAWEYGSCPRHTYWRVLDVWIGTFGTPRPCCWFLQFVFVYHVSVLCRWLLPDILFSVDPPWEFFFFSFWLR